MKICVIGLGYIGLPTAAIFSSNGVEVIGVDAKQEVVDTINKGNIHIEEPGLGELVKSVVESGHLKCTTKPVEADAFIICVPTPNLNDQYKSCDLKYVMSAVDSVVPVLKKGDLIIVESTIAPRTMEDEVKPVLESKGFTIGEDLYLAHCPERVLPGQILNEMINNNRIIGGITEKCTEKAAELYSKIVKGEIIKTEAKTAEMSKLVENTYRDVNIAFANELTQICNELQINVLDVIQMANKHPRVNILSPGPGVGGHCLAVDPYFICSKCPEHSNIISISRNTNKSMPNFVVAGVDSILQEDLSKKILVLGVTYKPNVDDMRESPSYEIALKLKDKGYNVTIYDPHTKNYSNVDISDLSAYDLVLCLVSHNEFKEIEVPNDTIVFDVTGSVFNREESVNYGNLYKYTLKKGR